MQDRDRRPEPERWSRRRSSSSSSSGRLRGHLLRQGARLRARRPARARAAAAARRRRVRRASTTSSCSSTGDDGAADAGDLLAARRGRRLEGRYQIELEPRERWELRVDVFPLARRRGGRRVRRAALRRGASTRVRDSLAAWQLRVPQLRATGTSSARVRQSVADLASLRMRATRRHRAGSRRRDAVVHDRLRPRHDHHVPADAALRPELARTRSRCSPSCRRPRTTRRSTPSRARSSTRCATARRERWFERYYGTVDATPLYLILLSEVWRWTDDAALVRELKEPALARSLDRRVRRPRRRRLRRVRAAHPHGLENQSWKDSGDSQRFHDGRSRRRRSRRARCRATSTTRSGALAELAREVWRDRELAERLERRRTSCASASTRRSGSRRGGYYALALDGEKRQVDSLCSNIGHLLWSGIVPPRARRRGRRPR
jgi:hypothetical protein